MPDPTVATPLEVHDPQILARAAAVLDTCRSGKQMQDAVIAAVKRNERWRGEQCINLLAPEAPTSPAVRALLSAEVGTRAAEGHIGKVNGHDRGHALWHARAGDGRHRRFHGACFGRKATPRECNRGRDRVSPALSNGE